MSWPTRWGQGSRTSWGSGGSDLPVPLDMVSWLDPTSGVTTDGAAQFVAASNQRLVHPTLKPSGSFAVGGWFYIDAMGGVQSTLSAFDGLGGSDGSFGFNVGPAGAAAFTLFQQAVTNTSVLTTALAPAGSWFFVVGWYSAALGTMSVKLNGTPTISKAIGFTPTFTSSATFAIASRSGSNPIESLTGRADSCFFYGGEFDDSLAMTIYNGGAGYTFATLPPSIAAGMVAWWDLDERTGNRADSKGAFTLTAVNTPVGIEGKTSGPATDNDSVRLWMDRGPLARDDAQAAYANRPTYRTGVINGMPGVQFDGTDDFLSATIGTTNTAATQIAVVYTPGGLSSDQYITGSLTGGGGLALRNLNGTLAASAGAFVSSISSVNANAVPKIVVGIADGTNVTVRVNGVAYASAATPYAPNPSEVVGARTTAPANPFAGFLGDRVVYDRALSLAEIQQWEAFLTSRYGL